MATVTVPAPTGEVVGRTCVVHRGTGREGDGTEDLDLKEMTMAMDLMEKPETGEITGTQDCEYNLIWFTEACLSNALRMEVYARDAEREGDEEMADLFRRAQQESRKGAEQGKQLLARRLQASMA